MTGSGYLRTTRARGDPREELKEANQDVDSTRRHAIGHKA